MKRNQTVGLKNNERETSYGVGYGGGMRAGGYHDYWSLPPVQEADGGEIPPQGPGKEGYFGGQQYFPTPQAPPGLQARNEMPEMGV